MDITKIDNETLSVVQSPRLLKKRDLEMERDMLQSQISRMKDDLAEINAKLLLFDSVAKV